MAVVGKDATAKTFNFQYIAIFRIGKFKRGINEY